MLAEDHNGKRFHYAATNPMTGFELRVDGGLHSQRHLFLLITVVCAFPLAAFLAMTGLIVVGPQRLRSCGMDYSYSDLSFATRWPGPKGQTFYSPRQSAAPLGYDSIMKLSPEKGRNIHKI